MNKIPIYFFPGMISNSLIFEKIELDHNLFTPVFFEWLPVEKNQSLEEYSNRYIEMINHPNPVLIGVSLGGIIAQEIAKKIKVRKTIIISSVRSTKEYPWLYRFAKYTKLYRLLPTNNINGLIEFLSNRSKKSKREERKALYDRYLTERSKDYIDWCIDQVMHWKQTEAIENVIQIHGDKDEIFPIKNIKNALVVKGGTHAMILTKYNWFNTQLPNIIQTNAI
ncbi:YqiA/YcfP family alpha/beta fold hydrolase [Myroides pelagicus]|uniref:Alpha/beta hydrolase n=1 Tax=Myroides pelagicus TaxID=270914 RepID=A0A7K1GMU4_9FLAO|nr:alpha/beta hydrolase [Myroides pelagicus]MEC4114345.1 alpha/beta hydrolase [Myroides pelagicus]MTH29869.1 alpha/beta hydrolase [Myroides pelagicus]